MDCSRSLRRSPGCRRLFPLLLGVSGSRGLSQQPSLPTDCIALARHIYETTPPPQLVGYLAGGGAQLMPWLLAVPGASRSVLELVVPYTRPSLAQTLGDDLAPSKCVTAAVAQQMADRAFERARRLSAESAADAAEVGTAAEQRHMGVGLTASLSSHPPKRGEHKCYIAVRTREGTYTTSIILDKVLHPLPLCVFPLHALYPSLLILKSLPVSPPLVPSCVVAHSDTFESHEGARSRELPFFLVITTVFFNHKGARSRELEDAVVSRCALLSMARACGLRYATESDKGRDFWQLAPDAREIAPGARETTLIREASSDDTDGQITADDQLATSFLEAPPE